MATRQYIGARYVIKIYENSQTAGSAEWEANTSYEPLTMVTYQNSSYLSKKAVPASVGNPASNTGYWALTGAYNGQIASLQSQINTLNSDVQTLTNKTDNFATPEDYGAVGDGITDDSQAFLDCVTAVGEGGTIVLLPNSKYLVSVEIPAVNIIGNNATIVAKANLNNGNYAIKIVPNARKHVTISDFTIDCGGTTPTNGLNGIYIDGLKTSQVQNVKIINVGERGIYVTNSFDVTFKGILIYKPMHVTDTYGVGIECPCSDLIFTDITIIGFKTGIDMSGANIFDNIHIWVGVEVTSANRADTVGFNIEGGIIASNIYLDSVCDGFVVGTNTSRFILSDIHWELFDDTNTYVLIKNPSSDAKRLNSVVCNNVYINTNTQPTVNYQIFNLGSPKLSNISPNFLDVTKTYGSVPHTFSAKCHAVRDIVRAIGDYIWIDIELTADEAMTTSDVFMTMTSEPMRTGKYILGMTNTTPTRYYINNNSSCVTNLAQYDKVYICGLIPRN